MIVFSLRLRVQSDRGFSCVSSAISSLFSSLSAAAGAFFFFNLTMKLLNATDKGVSDEHSHAPKSITASEMKNV